MVKTEDKKFPYSFSHVYKDKLYTFNFRKRITLSELSAAVKFVVEAVFSEDKSTYHPEYKQVAIASAIMLFFTNYEKTIDLDELSELMDTTNFFNDLVKEINEKQYFVFEDSVDEQIENIKGKSNIDLFFSDARNILKNWDKKLSKTIKMKSVKNIIDNFSKANVSEKELISILVDKIKQEKKD